MSSADTVDRSILPSGQGQLAVAKRPDRLLLGRRAGKDTPGSSSAASRAFRRTSVEAFSAASEFLTKGWAASAGWLTAGTAYDV
ncbi:hypothetical protein AQJ54_41735 [Streptomyces griseorubiginosus]|uniref:Uncharacterized protein n=1 Tax=Streptomyces griseorubiginosus TaxID=67304 RepID=A0A117QWR3_9ACTN|nr:hypothetical protein AQJ54_41735 [Streptomyces griseorubiginosus]